MFIAFGLYLAILAYAWIHFYRKMDVFGMMPLGILLLAAGLGFGLAWGISDLTANMQPEFLRLSDVRMLPSVGLGLGGHFIWVWAGQLVLFGLLVLILRDWFSQSFHWLAIMGGISLGTSIALVAWYMSSMRHAFWGGEIMLVLAGNMLFSHWIAYGASLMGRDSIPDSALKGFAWMLAGSLLWLGTQTVFFSMDVRWEWEFLWVIVFLMTMSLWPQMTNNALNMSEGFDYRTGIDQSAITGRQIVIMLILILLSVLMAIVQAGEENAPKEYGWPWVWVGTVVGIFWVRLPRITLIQNHWARLKFQSPGQLAGAWGVNFPVYLILQPTFKVSGPSCSEQGWDQMIGKWVRVIPHSPSKAYLHRSCWAMVEGKQFLENAQSFYRLRLFLSGKEGASQQVMLSPRTDRKRYAFGEHTLMALCVPKSEIDGSLTFIPVSELAFKQWVVMVDEEGWTTAKKAGGN